MVSVLQRVCTTHCTTSQYEQADVFRTVQDVLDKMADPCQVLWAPGYGAAALQHYTPRPCARAEIHVVGLDGWSSYQHTCASMLSSSRIISYVALEA